MNIDSEFLTQIISLNGQVRSKKLTNSLNEQGITFRLAEGVLISDQEFISEIYHDKKISKFITQRNITKGEVGCALAHKNATNKFLESDFDFTIIFEDDAELISNLDLPSIKYFLDSLKPRILFLGWLPGYALAKSIKKQNSQRVVSLITPPTCAFAYALNRRAANLILDFNYRIIDVADWPIQVFKGLEFGAIPIPSALAPQNPDFSLIGKRVEQKNKVLSPFQSKLMLLYSFLMLLILNNRYKFNFSIRQILHRLILKDFFYKYGKTSISNRIEKNEIVFIPDVFSRLLSFLTR